MRNQSTVGQFLNFEKQHEVKEDTPTAIIDVENQTQEEQNYNDIFDDSKQYYISEENFCVKCLGRKIKNDPNLPGMDDCTCGEDIQQ